MYSFAMNKTIICLFLLICIGSSLGKRKKREIVNNQTSENGKDMKNNHTSLLTDVRLFDLSPLFTDPEEPETAVSNPTGLVEILEPGSSEYLFLCFPQDVEEYHQAYVFSHVVCRQLGYMTFTSMHRKRTLNGKPYHGLKSSSYACSGQEQNVSFCKKNNITRGNCRILTEVTCGACYNAVSGSSGTIKTPGFPIAYLSDVTCEWDITAPDDHSISMTFHHLEGLFQEFTTVDCPLHKSYVELISGSSMEMSFHRYCSIKDLKNVTIPFHRVKIRLFTGLYSQVDSQIQHKEKGISISYEASPIEKTSNWLWKMVFLTLFILIFMATTVLCHYCQKYKLFPAQSRENDVLPTVNVPSLAEINRAYEFQRCTIQQSEKENQGLRLRSNGSNAKISRIFFPSTTGTTYEISKDYNKKPIEIETPKTIIPNIILHDECGNEEQLDPLGHVKTNLLNRYSGSHSDNASTKQSESSFVFYPAAQSFEIYSSVSSEKDLKKKNETDL